MTLRRHLTCGVLFILTQKIKAHKVLYFVNKLLPLQTYSKKPMNRQGLTVVLMDEASAFIRSLPQKAQKKVTYNLLKVEGGEKDNELFKKLDNTEIWEFRTLFNGICYRLFAFWDTEQDTLVIATHGIVKKTQKTPRKEIDKAEAIRKEYFENKKK